MQPSFISCDWHRLPLWLCQLLVMIWGAATTEDNCYRDPSPWPFFQSPNLFQFPQSWGFFHLTLPATVPTFHFILFFNYQTTIHFLWHLALLKCPGPHSKYPIWDGWASVETVMGRSQPPSYLPCPMAFCSCFLLFDYHAMFTKHHWMVRALRIRIRKLDVIRILLNNKLMNILEQGMTWLGICALGKSMCSLRRKDWIRESLKSERSIKGKVANHEKSGYNPLTKRDWGGDVTKGGLDSIDGIFILQMSKRVLSEVLSWRRGTGGGKERGGNFFLKSQSSSILSFYPSICRKECFDFIFIIFNLEKINCIQTTALAMVILSPVSSLRETPRR